MFLTRRPRNVDSSRAAALLYGDLGTSKAYVIGLAFALAGYASFWLIAAVSLLTLLIGINYITICKCYPNGGGVYASVRHRSEILSIIGACFIMADYLVTAALSSLAAFTYLGVSDPVFYAAIAIIIIGMLNYLGPRHTGTLALMAGIATFLILTILVISGLKYIPQAWHHLAPVQDNGWTFWRHFVGVIVALSGIEAIANTTGVMKLNPKSTETHPLVTNTAKKAIIPVILEVAIYTTFFAFIVNAIDTFTFSDGSVNAPGHPNVRDYMLRYLGETFIGATFGPTIGYWFGVVIALALAVLLLSAVNTSISALVSLQYLMAHDKEIPSLFQKMNRFGVPLLPLLAATVIPLILLLTFKDISLLASLYAIGFVGAIATNLGATSTDKTLDLKTSERTLMFFSFLLMAAIEITIFFEKPDARIYALMIIFFGLLLRALSRKRRVEERMQFHPDQVIPLRKSMQEIPLTHSAKLYTLLCVMTTEKNSFALQLAIKESERNGWPLHLLFIRKQEVIGEKDLEKDWESDPIARRLFTYAQQKSSPNLLYCHYCVSDSTADTIRIYIDNLEINHLIIDKKNCRILKKSLPQDLHISII